MRQEKYWVIKHMYPLEFKAGKFDLIKGMLYIFFQLQVFMPRIKY